MVEVVNLRRARKARDRNREAADAAENRVLFGRTKAEKRLTDSLREKAARDLDAQRLAPSDED